MAQASPEELQLCYLLLCLYTWQILTPGFTSVFSSAKSALLRNEKDERLGQSALTLCPGFDGG